MPKIRGRVRLGILALLATALPVAAHVGSPDVYLEGRAGPYQLFVTVRPPSVIPGVAELEVRSESKGVRELRAVPLPISSVGASASRGESRVNSGRLKELNPDAPR